MDKGDDYLTQEYFHLQKVVEDYDAKALTTKAWSVTFSAAAIGFAYDKQQIVILAVSIVTALAFWLVEALIKVNQQAYYPRIGEIEDYFAGGERRVPMQIGRTWSAAFRTTGKYQRAFRIALWPHVFMPHVAIAALGLALVFLHPPGHPDRDSGAKTQPEVVMKRRVSAAGGGANTGNPSRSFQNQEGAVTIAKRSRDVHAAL